MENGVSMEHHASWIIKGFEHVYVTDERDFTSIFGVCVLVYFVENGHLQPNLPSPFAALKNKY